MYQIPNVPKLNFKKDDDGNYRFYSSTGVLIFNQNKWQIKNINIIIQEKIFVSFDICTNDYNITQNILDENILNSQLKWNLDCKCESYNVYLFNFHEVNANIGPFFSNVSGYAYNSKFVKNNNKITNEDKVRVWNVLEPKKIIQPQIKKFDSIYLSDIYLKSIETHDYIKENNLKLTYNLQENQKESFNQLLNTSFLFYKKNNINEIISNIDTLCTFFDSKIKPMKMKIIENKSKEKLEIEFTSNFRKLKGSSIFDDNPYNFYKFLNSTYDSYISVKKSDIDIDLLLEYYAFIKNQQYSEVKLILSSIFMEILKNDKSNPTEGEFYKNLKKRFVDLNLIKLLEQLQPKIYSILENLELTYLEQDYNKNHVKKVFEVLKENYILSSINFYRNKVIHSGRIKINSNDKERFVMDYFIKNSKKGLALIQQELIDEITGELINKFENLNCFEINIQCEVFENLIEIYLMNLLSVNCELINVEKFRLNDSNIIINSKEYIKQFK